MKLTTLTAYELGKKIKAKEVSAFEAVKEQFEAMEAKEEKYHCYISLSKEEALKEAERVDKGILAGEYTDSLLAGVPVAVKDNICTKKSNTTCASRMLSGFLPPYNATVVDRIKNAGAVIIGKTNMDEFAMGSTTETSFFGVTKNPWNTEHVPGGSSGGSAAAVAAEEVFYALGSDTGGSIRHPASFCGVTGLKPTYGTVSRYGLIAYASSLDQIGPIARDVTDCALVYQLLCAKDAKDSTSVDSNNPVCLETLKQGVKGLKIGIPRDYFLEGLDPDVKTAVLAAASELESQGAVLEELDLKAADYAIPAYYVIASAEASSNLSRYDGVKYGYRTAQFEGLQDVYKGSRSEGFGDEVQRRMMIGAFVLSSGYYDAYYNKALKVKAVIKQEFDKAFETYDMLLGPTAPTTAPLLSKSLSDPLKMYLGDIYTVSVNLAGLPAVSVPCGLDRKGLPIGLQLIGKPFGENTILRAAYAYEQTRSYLRPFVD